MSIRFSFDSLEVMTPYYKAIKNADSSLSSVQVLAAANVLRDLEEDPNNCVDYKSIAIAINEAKGELI